MAKFTVTVGAYYPAYEHAEGGYYVECAEAHQWIKCRNYRTAKKYFNRYIKMYKEEYGFEKVAKCLAHDYEAENSPYIGKGHYICLDKGNKPTQWGKPIYC